MSAIHYDLVALQETGVSGLQCALPKRYAVLGCIVVAGITEHDDTIIETDSLWEAMIVADLESHCQGQNGWDTAVVFDQHNGRFLPPEIRMLKGGLL